MNRFSECYVLKVLRTDRRTDVKIFCKEQSSLKLIHVGISNVENVNSLSISASIVTRQLATRFKNVIFCMTNINFFPTQRFIRCETHSASCQKGNREHSAWAKQPQCESDHLNLMTCLI
jgi:hypothetical protein